MRGYAKVPHGPRSQRIPAPRMSDPEIARIKPGMASARETHKVPYDHVQRLSK